MITAETWAADFMKAIEDRPENTTVGEFITKDLMAWWFAMALNAPIPQDDYIVENKANRLKELERLTATYDSSYYVKRNSLGEMSIIEYLCQDNPERLFDVVGLLKRMHE